MAQYQVVTAEDTGEYTGEFCDYVNKLLADGWELAGGVAVNTDGNGVRWFYQAVTKRSGVAGGDSPPGDGSLEERVAALQRKLAVGSAA